MGQGDMAKRMDRAQARVKGGLGDEMEQNQYKQIHPAISTPGHEMEQRFPATAVVLSKENAAGLRDHGFDVMGRNTVVGAGLTVAVATFNVPQRHIAICKKFGWYCPAAGFANVRFQILANETTFPSTQSTFPNNYLPSGNSVDYDMLAECHEFVQGPAIFAINATNGGGAAISVSARVTGYYWVIGTQEKEIGDRQYAVPDYKRMG